MPPLTSIRAYQDIRVASAGFTLIELLVAMTISLTLIAAVYQLFHTQHHAFMRQDQIVEVQQNLRATMAALTRAIQLAGYDPTRTSNTGFVTSFPAPNDGFTIDYAVDRDIIAFTVDDNENGVIDVNDNERIAFRLNDTTLEKFSADRNTWEPLAFDIDALDFIFLNGASAPTVNPDTFRAVEVSILARAEKTDRKYINTAIYVNQQGQLLCPSCASDHYHRRLLSKTIQLRNLGLQ